MSLRRGDSGVSIHEVLGQLLPMLLCVQAPAPSTVLLLMGIPCGGITHSPVLWTQFIGIGSLSPGESCSKGL